MFVFRSALYRGLPMALRGISLREVNIWRSVVLPLTVAGVALAIAIVGAVVVGSGGGTDSLNLFVDRTLAGNSQQFLGGLISASALFALAAGMASAVNPCGFAMLPAYLGLYLGSNSKGETESGPKRGQGAEGRWRGVCRLHPFIWSDWRGNRGVGVLRQ